MLKYLNNKRAQASVGEYVLVLLLVVGMTMAMTFYFKRAILGRMHDARTTMFNMVLNRSALYYTGDIPLAYEPYYGNTASLIDRDEYSKTGLLEGVSTGIFRKTYDTLTSVVTTSETAPPMNAN